MKQLPESFLKRGLELAEECTFCGLPLTQFTRDELLAIAAIGWKRVDEEIKESIRQLDFLSGLRNI